MLKIGKLKIHWSFFFFLLLAMFLGKLKLFLLLVTSTTIHEFLHVLAARLFGVPVESVMITPIGETAYLLGFDRLAAFKRYIILAAGPLTNILTAIFIFSFYRDYFVSLNYFAYINLSIGFFNLMPIYPLDGGKLLFIFLGNRLGILESVALVRKLSKTGLILLFLAGFAQLVFFPFNISLIAIGVFLFGIFEREKRSMLFSYYNCMLNKTGRLQNGLTVKTVAFAGDTPASYAEKKFTWDYFHIILILEGGKVTASITEKQIFDAGLSAPFGDGTKLLDII